MASADAQTAARVERMGMSLIKPETGLAALEGVLRVGAVRAGRSMTAAGTAAGSVVAAVPFRWPTFLQRFGGKVPALFAEMADQVAATSGKGENPAMLLLACLAQLCLTVKDSAHVYPVISLCLTTLPVCDCFRLCAGDLAGKTAAAVAGAGLSKSSVANLVASTVSAVLGPDVNPDEPLMASGLDSLGAVELRNSLQAQLPAGLELPATLLFDFPSINAISGYISSQVCRQKELQVCVEVSHCVQDLLIVHGLHSLLSMPCTMFAASHPAESHILCAACFVQVSEPEAEQPTPVAAPTTLSINPGLSGRIIAVTAYACRSPGAAISNTKAVDAITAISLQVSRLVCCCLKPC
jgi:acyl carrier protein